MHCTMSAAIEAGFNVAAAVLAVGVARWTRDVAYPRLAASVAATAATPGTLGTAATAAAGYLRTVGYDVVTDGVLTKCWLSAVIAFLVMGVGVCTLLDGAPRLFHRFKTQGSRSYFTPREWLQATAVSMFNLCLLGWLVIIPNWRLRAALHQPPLSEADPWRWNTELPKLAFCVLFVDVWFFLTHKLIHWGPLYTVIHKVGRWQVYVCACMSTCRLPRPRVCARDTVPSCDEPGSVEAHVAVFCRACTCVALCACVHWA